MKNEQQWKPSRIVWNEKKKRFEINRAVIYAGSVHIAQLQLKAYEQIIANYCKGMLLDCACGSVPYYQMYQPLVSGAYCIDKNETQHTDETVNLNETFLLKQTMFDTVLLTDAIAHISEPAQLLKTLSLHMRSGAHLILTTPFVYWASEYPNEYFHPTDTALRYMCSAAGLDVVHLRPYGGRADVLLDTLNKSMCGRWTQYLFRMLATLLIKTRWYSRVNENTQYSYAIGYTLVACKP